MKIFVAGATGVIGRRLVPMLVAGGHDVTGMTRSSIKAPAIEAMGAEPAVADVFDAERLTEAVVAARPDVVVHELTDLPQAMDPRKAETQLAGNDRIRSEGTPNLVAAAEAAGASAFVSQSIAFAYRPEGGAVKSEEDPLHLDAPWPWRRSVEALQDLEAATLGFKGRGVVLRYGWFYGPGSGYDPDVGSLARMVAKRRFPIVGKGDGVFSFIHVDDAARATVIAVERDDVSGVFNVVDDEPAPWREWLPVYAESIGARRPWRVPAFVARLAAGKMGVQTATQTRGADNAKAKRELDWELEHPSWREGFAANGR
jgi:nucleoside-diphosphate-sugar epimerase